MATDWWLRGRLVLIVVLAVLVALGELQFGGSIAHAQGERRRDREQGERRRDREQGERRRDPAPEVAPGAEIEGPAGVPSGFVADGFPIPDDQPPDYALASGHFFTQAVPGARRGFGFSVLDEAGVPFWTEYNQNGGLEALGYPTSRRFIWGDVVSQAFQHGLLLWRPEFGWAEVVPRESLPQLPPGASEPEAPLRLGSWSAHHPWSGWWWPANPGAGGPKLFDANGPLAKYDRFVSQHGQPNPGTLEWERTQISFAGLHWAGHCNGWAAAALLEHEPTEPRNVDGMLFTVADQKGLLSAYHFGDAAAWIEGADEPSLMPIDFHNRLIWWLGGNKRGFILTFRPSGDDEVWSFPAYRFEMTLNPDPVEPDVTHVRTAVWLSDNNVPADFVGVAPWKGGPQIYTYRLLGPRDAPYWAEWTGASTGGQFSRPSYIWYPTSKHRNLGRQLTSPNLDYAMLKNIIEN